MKQTLLAIALLFIGATVFAQVDENVAYPYDPNQNMVVDYETEASYAGGQTRLITDLWNTMEFTQEAIDAKLDTEVMISFDVEVDGSVTGIEVIMPAGMGVDEELSRVLYTLKFIPATAEGAPMKMNLVQTIPIRTGPNSKLKKN